MNICKIHHGVILLLLLFFAVPGVSPQVVINEIAWMGTEASSNDEWIELYNYSQSSVDLAGWKLKSSDNSPSISLSGIINSHGYYLLERTDETTISDITADFIYTQALVNSGENLLLISNKSTTIDQVDCSDGWFAGNNDDKISMERIDPYSQGSDPGNWGNNNESVINGHDAESNSIKGTPKQKNSIMDQSLPVLITDFNAQQKNDCIVILWKCQYQDEIIHFYLYRSQNNKDYTNIAQIPVDQNRSSYEYYDHDTENQNTYYYKLEILNHNSTKKYYGPLNIVLKKNDSEYNQSNLDIFPNPFNPATTLFVTIAEPDWSEEITCQIFNCLGRKVTTLYRPPSRPGQFSLNWNGCNAQGVTVPSGIYFAKLYSSDRILATSRMVKLK
ncbi:MAG: lamin tail domain-containing protein [bacterium]